MEIVADELTGWLTYKEEALSSAEPDLSLEIQSEIPFTIETVAP